MDRNGTNGSTPKTPTVVPESADADPPSPQAGTPRPSASPARDTNAPSHRTGAKESPKSDGKDPFADPSTPPARESDVSSRQARAEESPEADVQNPFRDPPASQSGEGSPPRAAENVRRPIEQFEFDNHRPGPRRPPFWAWAFRWMTIEQRNAVVSFLSFLVFLFCTIIAILMAILTVHKYNESADAKESESAAATAASRAAASSATASTSITTAPGTVPKVTTMTGTSLIRDVSVSINFNIPPSNTVIDTANWDIYYDKDGKENVFDKLGRPVCLDPCDRGSRVFANPEYGKIADSVEQQEKATATAIPGKKTTPAIRGLGRNIDNKYDDVTSKDDEFTDDDDVFPNGYESPGEEDLIPEPPKPKAVTRTKHAGRPTKRRHHRPVRGVAMAATVGKTFTTHPRTPAPDTSGQLTSTPTPDSTNGGSADADTVANEQGLVGVYAPATPATWYIVYSKEHGFTILNQHLQPICPASWAIDAPFDSPKKPKLMAPPWATSDGHAMEMAWDGGSGWRHVKGWSGPVKILPDGRKLALKRSKHSATITERKAARDRPRRFRFEAMAATVGRPSRPAAELDECCPAETASKRTEQAVRTSRVKRVAQVPEVKDPVQTSTPTQASDEELEVPQSSWTPDWQTVQMIYAFHSGFLVGWWLWR